MAKKKEWYTDYATHAFVRYAMLGCPTREECEDMIRRDCLKCLAFAPPSVVSAAVEAAIKKKSGLLADIDAVNHVFDSLAKSDRPEIAQAVRAVYFVNPKGKPQRGDIINRVRRYAFECPADERTVYRWLKTARVLFCQERGLDYDTSDTW